MSRHHFVTTYFNPTSNQLRKRLTQEFCDRNPWVTIIQCLVDNKYDIITKNSMYINGHYNYFAKEKLVNLYIQKNKDSIGSLTIIDSDLDLYDNFKELVIKEMDESESEPTFMQPFRVCKETDRTIGGVPGGVPILSVPERSFAFCVSHGLKMGHTGYIHTYNKKFLELIDYELPEEFILGGFDTVLYLSLVGELEILNNLIKNENYQRLVKKFYLKTCNKVKVKYISGSIVHHFHGNKNARYSNRFNKYEAIGDAKECDASIINQIVSDYFKQRNETV